MGKTKCAELRVKIILKLNETCFYSLSFSRWLRRKNHKTSEMSMYTVQVENFTHQVCFGHFFNTLGSFCKAKSKI